MNNYIKLINIGIEADGIKTDALLFNINTDNELLFKNFEINNFKIGGYKIEEDKCLIMTDLSIRERIEYLEIKKFEVKRYELEHEKKYNHRDKKIRKLYLEEIKNIINLHNLILIIAKHAGDGKSYAATHFLDDILQYLITTPFNKLAINFKKKGYNAITFNKLLGINIDNDDANASKNKYKISDEIKIVIIDEIFLMDIKKLSKLNKFILNNPNMKFIATGDIFQLE